MLLNSLRYYLFLAQGQDVHFNQVEVLPLPSVDVGCAF